jgi:predicted XRE-type DNA-binding protein
MKSGNVASNTGHITTGDIFDDLGFSPAETLEAKIKSDLLHAIVQHSEAHHLSQAELAQALNIHQPDVSNLLKGKISKFSITRLIQFAARLNLEPRVEIAVPKKANTITLQAKASKTSRKREPLLKA